MELIQPSDLYFGRRGWIARLQARLIMKVAALKKINRLYESAFSYEGPYPEGLLYNLGVSYDVAPSDLKNIPASGPAIVIANHPTGALDGMILIDLLSKARPDVKFMGNFLLSRIGPLKDVYKRQFLKRLMKKYKDKGVNLTALYSDEMHIQQDWGYFGHHEGGQFAERYLCLLYTSCGRKCKVGFVFAVCCGERGADAGSVTAEKTDNKTVSAARRQRFGWIRFIVGKIGFIQSYDFLRIIITLYRNSRMMDRKQIVFEMCIRDSSRRSAHRTFCRRS